MAWSRVIFVLLAIVKVANARPFHSIDALSPATRQLLQVPTNTDCPAGCDKASGGCVLDSTSGGYRCIKCLGSLLVDSRDGQCYCPAGRYAGVNTCLDCAKGSYCLGGEYSTSPAETTCGTDLTTLGKRSINKKACVNMAGTSYAVDSSGTPSATSCPANTYGPGLRKQRQCVPCPTGYITLADRSTSAAQCVVPAGYFLKGPGQVAPCPKGEYKNGTGAVAACSKCKEGVTTEAEASTAASDCNIVLPTYYPYTIDSGSGEVTVTKKCPQKYWCAGGRPTAEFNPDSPVADVTTTVERCPYGTWTEGLGAYTADQCLTPPGHFTNTGTGVTDLCPNGQYRAEWMPYAQAANCDVCGDLIQSEATDQITAIDIKNETESKVDVATTSAACYILAGQGMMYSRADNRFRAVNCDTNNYGVSAKTTGLAAFPCRSCPAGMQTFQTGYPATSSQYFFTHPNFGSDAIQGFDDPKACVTLAGYGYNGRVASKCTQGSYNAAGNYGTCTQCPAGLTTSRVDTEQVVVTDCKLAEGYGFYDNAYVACPIGTYRTGMAANTTATCTPCTTGLTTSRTGGRTASDCNLCLPGYGGASDCTNQCGGLAATYGPAGRSTEDGTTACLDCPTMSVGFSFDYKSVNQAFTPNSVARLGAETGADCLAEFAQIVDAAWWLPGANASAVAGVSTFGDCVDACTGDCQFVTFDYNDNTCYKKEQGTASANGDVLAFKAVLGGDTTATSIKAVKGKFLPSGSYTFYAETADSGLGSAQAPVSTTSLNACLAACDSDGGCAAVAMTGVAAGDSDTIATCKKISGDTTVAAFKRSVTKAVVTKLSKTAAAPLAARR